MINHYFHLSYGRVSGEAGFVQNQAIDGKTGHSGVQTHPTIAVTRKFAFQSGNTCNVRAPIIQAPAKRHRLRQQGTLNFLTECAVLVVSEAE